MITSYLLFFLIFHRINLIYSGGDISLENEGSEERELRNSPPDHEIPYSEHENPPEPSTRPKYEAPGQWAKPSADRNIPLEFVPSTMYAQVRGTHTVERVPRHQALLDATTDEEKENAGRLKEVVTNKKVNTIYTEEGYEDAAYDHAGQHRDADFQEEYDRNVSNEDESHDAATSRASLETGESSEEDDDNIERSSTLDERRSRPAKLKNKKYSPKTGNEKVWAGAGVNPVAFVKKEGLTLEKYLESEAEKANLGAETEVPENLKCLTSDSESSEDGVEGSTHQLRRVFMEDSVINPVTKPEYVRTAKKSPSTTVVIPQPVARAVYADDRYPTYHDVKSEQYPTYQELMATRNRGQVFRDSKKSKPGYVPSNEATLNPVKPRPVTKSLVQNDESSSEESLEYSMEFAEMSRKTSRPREYPRQQPPQALKYTTVTTPGMVQAMLKSPLIIKAITPPSYSRETSEELLPTTTSGTRDLPTRPIYTVILRAPSKPCDERSDESNLQESVPNYELLNHLTNSVNPSLVKAEVISDVRMIEPAVVPPLGQVTYADYLHNAHGQPAKSSETQESSSTSEESRQVSSENPQSLPPRHYGPQRNRLLSFFSWLTGLNAMGKIITPRMRPPSPMSRSRYAEYAVRRSGVQLPQKNSWSHDPYYNPPFQVNGGVPRRFKREGMGNNGEFLPIELLMDENVTVNSSNSRKKRSNENLLNDAPKIAEALVDGDIKARFGDKSNAEGSSEELGNKGEGKVEVDVPEFDFSQALDDIGSYEQFNLVIETKNDTSGSEKYPFYKNDRIPNNSALKYVINPQQIPRKSFGGMEFYNSRDRYLKCDDVNPDLSEVLPEKEEPNPDQEPNENLPRLNGLGDQLSCFKAKYFDKNPLDNPLFMERRVDTPHAPNEFNLQKFRDRMTHLPSEAEALVYRRVSRKPEINGLSDRKDDKVVNHSKSKSNHNSAPNHRVKKKRRRQKNQIRTMEPVRSPYEKQVYEDVMGTIKNQATVKSRKLPFAHPSGRGRKNKAQKKPKPHNLHPEYHRPPSPWKPKGILYRTDKVLYRVRPRMQSATDPRHIGYYKPVMVYKRSIDSNGDLQTAESRNTLGNLTPIKASRDKKSGVTSPVTTKLPFDTSGHSTLKSVSTAKDRRSFKPRGTVRYGKFKSEVGSVDPRRKEPRYNDATTRSDDLPAEGEVGETAAPYEVHETVVEQLTEAPEVSELREYLNSDLPGHNKAPESSGESVEKAELVEDDSAEEESGEEGEQIEGQGKQLGKLAESFTDGSPERVEADEESSSEAEPNEEAKEDKTSGEEEPFERFIDRPDSPAEDNYDPKYAELGPRINKPAFHHPPFNPPRYERHRGKNYESLEEEEPKKKSSKYVSPWDENKKEASGESKVAEDTLAKYEYPWERRARLALEKGKNEQNEKIEKNKDNKYYHRYWKMENGDQSPSQSGFNFEITHPWKEWSSPHEDNDFRRWSSGMFDDYRVKPEEFNYHEESERSSTDDEITRAINNFKKRNFNTPTTPITPQIPPTSATSIPRNQPTTPMVKGRYTVRPFKQTRRVVITPRKSRDPNNKKSVILPIILQPSPFIIRKKVQSAGSPLKIHPRHSNHRQSSVSKPESTTFPSKRTIAHRSRVSTEEIITKTSESNPLENKRFSSTQDDGSGKNERVQKVSIVTKETPDHIYRTKKIDKDGVKRKFITITPNTSTDKLKIDEDSSMSDMSMEDSMEDMDEDIQERMDNSDISQEENIPEQDFLPSLLMRVPSELDWIERSGEVN